jgi:hypothetical protein
MYFKTIDLSFMDSDSRFVAGYNHDSDSVIFTVNDFIKDEEESTENHLVMKENDKLEVYLSSDELKELIRSLQSILPEGEME